MPAPESVLTCAHPATYDLRSRSRHPRRDRDGRAAERKGGWITYRARDPRQEDLKGNLGGPIYLGQSKEFARACRRRGYDIANPRRLQKAAGPPITRHDIPTDWLWEFSLEEASADGIRVRLGCRNCRKSLLIDLSHFGRLDTPPKDRRAIRDDPL